MDNIKHLYELSKISYTESEIEKMSEKMDDIILLMDKIKTADLSTDVGFEKNDDYKNLRKDIPQDAYSDKLMSNAKCTENNSFSVPKVM